MDEPMTVGELIGLLEMLPENTIVNVPVHGKGIQPAVCIDVTNDNRLVLSPVTVGMPARKMNDYAIAALNGLNPYSV